jgi:hypothetical protein
MKTIFFVTWCSFSLIQYGRFDYGWKRDCTNQRHFASKDSAFVFAAKIESDRIYNIRSIDEPSEYYPAIIDSVKFKTTTK